LEKSRFNEARNQGEDMHCRCWPNRWYDLRVLQRILIVEGMKALLTSKGQVTPQRGRATKTILPDFLGVAHAATQADSLATDDRGCLRTYFPNIRLIVPPESP